MHHQILISPVYLVPGWRENRQTMTANGTLQARVEAVYLFIALKPTYRSSSSAHMQAKTVPV